MDRHQMLKERAKLNESQRAKLREIWSAPLDSLTVNKVGHKTKVTFRSGGFTQHVELGPRGALLKREIY